jgi:hypothetical protein
MAINQFMATTGNRRLRSDPQAANEARLQFLPAMMGLKQEKQIAEDRLALDERRLAQEKAQAEKTLKHQEEAEKKQFGLEVAKLGVGALGSGALSGVGGLFGFGGEESNVTAANIQEEIPYIPATSMEGPETVGAIAAPAAATGTGIMSSIKDMAGPAIAGGLLGFGAGKLFTDGGFKGALVGAGAGMLPGLAQGLGGLFSGAGAGGFDFSNLLAGGLTGAIGGYFS